MKTKKVDKLRIVTTIILMIVMVFMILPAEVNAATLKTPYIVKSSRVASAQCANQIEWKAIQGASGYRVYRSESRSGTYRALGNTTKLKYVNTSVKSGVKYYYKIKAYKNVGEKKIYSSFSNYKSVVTRLSSLSTPVISVSHTEVGINRISWKSIANATGYRVYRSLAKEGPYTRIAITSDLSYNDKDIVEDKTYYYKVRAYKSYAIYLYSPYSNIEKNNPLKIKKPTYVRAIQYDIGANKISWSSTKSATGYKVYRSTSLNGTYKFICSTRSLSYIDTNVNSNQKYYYRVRGYLSGTSTLYGTYSSKVAVVTKGSNTGKSVFVACGHGTYLDGGWNSGAYATIDGKFVTEAELMLPITKVTVEYLRKSGVTVYTDADTDNNLNMIACVDWANKVSDLSAYLSIHCDWYKAKTGMEALNISTKGRKLGTCLRNAVKETIDIVDKGNINRTDLYELTDTNAPATIMETGCITKNYDVLTDYEAYGKQLAKGMCDYLGVEFCE